MAIRMDKTTQMLARSLDTRLQRNGLLTSNLANIDTPHYKARDLEFEGFLVEAKGASEAPRSYGAQDAMIAAATDVVVEDDSIPTGLDQNGVDLDETVAKLADNTMRYNTALELVRRKLGLLAYAVTEGQG